jgi:Skp family chaperone for outer membrane proteins
MKKIILITATVCVLLYADTAAYAQQTAIKNNEVVAPTPKNVLAWSKELLPRLERIAEKLQKIKPRNSKDAESKNVLQKGRKLLQEINEAGEKLTEAEARKHDAWFRKAILTLQNNCPDGPDGSECCFSCGSNTPSGGHGWNVMWCMANCFVASFPWPD